MRNGLDVNVCWQTFTSSKITHVKHLSRITMYALSKIFAIRPVLSNLTIVKICGCLGPSGYDSIVYSKRGSYLLNIYKYKTEESLDFMCLLQKNDYLDSSQLTKASCITKYLSSTSFRVGKKLRNEQVYFLLQRVDFHAYQCVCF